ncbi:cytochrome P450 [Halobacillus mangrovi]|uniref:Cytochrome P450 n=1 Tax=Halobacillus mangrovi TaxID=402384 RepID=A0A1W5ZV64_9BACI|nr:cytochrome P450 [Halobacillus mangrovi]ARI77169.1 hypothetical protein HM131_10115 [Halobacillus mangrovi]
MITVRSGKPWGHMRSFRKDPLSFLQMAAKYDDEIVSFRLGHKSVKLLVHPSLVKEVLVSKADCFHKSKPFQELEPLLGNGLLLSENPTHQKQRRLIQPSFRPAHIKKYADLMAESTRCFLQDWGEREERWISNDLMELTLEIISQTMLGVDIENGHELVGKPLETVMEIATKRIRSVVRSPKSWGTTDNIAFKQAVDQLDGIVSKIIENRHVNKSNAEDLLGVLIQSQETSTEKMEVEQLRNEVMTILLAGHETTATALTWTMYLLMTNKNIYQKVQAEVDRLCKNDIPAYEEVNHLEYTEKVLLESLRLYPPAWLIGRLAIKEVMIGEYQFKRGQTVMISPYIMQRNSRYFEEPERFNPERFVKGKLQKVPEYVYFPFGGGTRVCIGKHFAMLEAIIVLGALMKNFNFYFNKESIIKADPLITLRLKQGLHAYVERRK